MKEERKKNQNLITTEIETESHFNRQLNDRFNVNIIKLFCEKRKVKKTVFFFCVNIIEQNLIIFFFA